MNANKKTVLLRFAPERRPRLYSVLGQSTPPSNVIHPAYHGSAAHVNQPSCDSACDSMRRGFFSRPAGLPGRPPAVAAAAEAATALRARAATAAVASLGGCPVSSSAFVLRVQLRSSHRINHRNGRAAMVHRLSHALDIPIPPQQLDRVHLPEAMRRDVLRQPERLRRPLHIPPHGLTRPVLPVIPPREHPFSPTGLRTHLRN